MDRLAHLASPIPNTVKGVSVNPDGESRHRHARADMARKERENQTRMEKKAKESKSPKRKVFRVESEETKDYVKESLNVSWDEAEEISFVSSAISIPQRPMFWRDNRCSDKALRCWQFASVVVEEGGGGLHSQFVSAVLQRKLDGKGPGAVEFLAVEGSRGKEGASWQTMENVGKRPVLQGMWAGGETFSPFLNADIRTSLFSADVLKKCALIIGFAHIIAEEGKGGEDGCQAPGKVRVKLGQKMKACFQVSLEEAM